MNRPSFEEICLQAAVALSARSTCRRLAVGAVIASTDFRKILAWGYNGNASGLKNDCDSDEPGKCGCIHAETNAVVNCDAPRATEKVVLCTHLPCVACAKLLINLGNVKRVLYVNDYRIKDSLGLFETVGIEHQQFEI